MKKFVFIDIDGTLYDHGNHRIPESAIKALRKAKENGHELFICTGRPKPVVESSYLDLPISGVIFAGGTHIEVNGKVIYQGQFPSDQMDEIVKYMQSHDIEFTLEGVERNYYTDWSYNYFKPYFCDIEGADPEMVQKFEERTVICRYEDYTSEDASQVAKIDLFAFIPAPSSDSVVSALYGGVMCGLGGGIVFSSGFSTGGSDIVVRLMKKKWPFVPIGIFTTVFDLTIAVITGIVFKNMSHTLYCGVAVFVTGRVVDAVVYKFDYSKVALIVTKHHEEVAYRLGKELHRGSTFLYGQGSYSHNDTTVVLTAVKKQQLAEVKDIVAQIDPEAFIIVQEAHQVLGDGFARYSKDAL